MDHDIAQINYDLNCLDGAANAVARGIARIAVRIADMERDRALLLAYVRAEKAMHRSLVERWDAGREMAIDAEFNAAHRALIDAGLLEDGA